MSGRRRGRSVAGAGARGLLRLVCVTAVAAVTGCSDGGPLAGPGTLTVTLLSPHGNEGAAVVSLVGAGVGAIDALGDTEVHRADAGDTTRLVLIDLDGGQLAFRMALGDTTELPAVVIEEVAGPDDELRTGLGLYRLDIRP